MIIPAEGHLLFAVNGVAALNGGLPNPAGVYSPDFWMGNGSDGIKMQCMNTIIDAVIWDDGATFPDPIGSSMSLMIDKYDSVSNDSGVNWETVPFTYGDGDYGTPGGVNDIQLSVGSAQIMNYDVYPNPVVGGSLTIKSNSSAKKQVSMYSISGQKVYFSDFYGQMLEINVRGFDVGVYVLKIMEQNMIIQKKIVVK